MKKKPQKNVKKKSKAGMRFELAGTVSLVETDSKGKETRHPIDAELVLKMLVKSLEDFINLQRKGQ
jgi:hypothetical protein